MKTLLDCDQVFDVLTRQNFPSGSDDDNAVELHLQGCHECRQLAEALRPAVGLLHESLFEDESRELPSYQSDEEVDLTARIMQQVCHVEVRQPQRWFSSEQLSAALAVVIVATAAVCAMAWQGSSQAPGDGRDAIASSALVSKSIQLASLNVSEACLLPAAVDARNNSSVSFDSARYQCCTSCHSKEQVDNVPAESILQNGGCFVCHDSSAD
jgi:predicted anti-sigma-YlaC factor YlaD